MDSQGETHTTVMGAAPEGAGDPQAAAQAVREMFTSIAPRYDLLNHLLSFNVDRIWWRKTARHFAGSCRGRKLDVLDLCCGTGDMTFALLRQAGNSSGQHSGVDFSHAMLQRAAQKSAGTSLRWIEADALRLPFPERAIRPGDNCIWLPQSGGLRCRPAGDCAGAAAGGRVRHSGFRGAARDGRKVVPHLLQASAAGDRDDNFRGARAVCIFAFLGGALSGGGGNAVAYAGCGIPRSFVDTVHVGYCGAICRKEVAELPRAAMTPAQRVKTGHCSQADLTRKDGVPATAKRLPLNSAGAWRGWKKNQRRRRRWCSE